MKLQTASETLSYIRELEEKAAEFYKALGQKYPDGAGVFEDFAKENLKYNSMIQRAYQSVITDAIEGCYAFDLDTDSFTVAIPSVEEGDQAAMVAKALAMEDEFLALYQLAAEQSDSLLADVPRNFKIVNKKRTKRLEKLKALG